MFTATEQFSLVRSPDNFVVQIMELLGLLLTMDFQQTLVFRGLSFPMEHY